jgi:hypothetical protein
VARRTLIVVGLLPIALAAIVWQARRRSTVKVGC